MDISLDLSEIIQEEELETLKIILKCNSDEELNDAIKCITQAALVEYLEMILGKQLPTRANEIRERKLYHLLKHYFNGRIPSEAEISAMFQLTSSGSRSLLRDVRTKYKYDLENELKNTINDILIGANLNNGVYRVVIQSDNILEELKQTVSIKAPNLDQISKVKNSAGVYNIPEDTYEVLCNEYGIELEASLTQEQG